MKFKPLISYNNVNSKERYLKNKSIINYQNNRTRNFKHSLRYKRRKRFMGRWNLIKYQKNLTTLNILYIPNLAEVQQEPTTFFQIFTLPVRRIRNTKLYSKFFWKKIYKRFNRYSRLRSYVFKTAIIISKFYFIHYFRYGTRFWRLQRFFCLKTFHFFKQFFFIRFIRLNFSGYIINRLRKNVKGTWLFWIFSTFTKPFLFFYQYILHVIITNSIWELSLYVNALKKNDRLKNYFFKVMYELKFIRKIRFWNKFYYNIPKYLWLKIHYMYLLIKVQIYNKYYVVENGFLKPFLVSKKSLYLLKLFIAMMQYRKQYLVNFNFPRFVKNFKQKKQKIKLPKFVKKLNLSKSFFNQLSFNSRRLHKRIQIYLRIYVKRRYNDGQFIKPFLYFILRRLQPAIGLYLIKKPNVWINIKKLRFNKFIYSWSVYSLQYFRFFYKYIIYFKVYKKINNSQNSGLFKKYLTYFHEYKYNAIVINYRKYLIRYYNFFYCRIKKYFNKFSFFTIKSILRFFKTRRVYTYYLRKQFMFKILFKKINLSQYNMSNLYHKLVRFSAKCTYRKKKLDILLKRIWIYLSLKKIKYSQIWQYNLSFVYGAYFRAYRKYWIYKLRYKKKYQLIILNIRKIFSYGGLYGLKPFILCIDYFLFQQIFVNPLIFYQHYLSNIYIINILYYLKCNLVLKYKKSFYIKILQKYNYLLTKTYKNFLFYKFRSKSSVHKYIDLITDFIHVSGYLPDTYNYQIIISRLQIELRPTGRVHIEHIRRKKSIFKMKLIFKKLFYGLYRIKNLSYVFGSKIIKCNIYNQYILKNCFVYRKNFKILIS